MINKTIAEIFRNIAKILELKGENVFRIRAYERAAQNMETLDRDARDLINENQLKLIPGIGVDLAGKIIEIAKTGKLRFYDQLKKTISPGLLDLLNIPSLGPKHAKLFSEKLKIKSISGLKKAALQGKLSGLKGIKEKTQENILKGIALLEKGRQRMDLATAMLRADEFIKPLKACGYAQKITVCGSLRRMKETIRDIDILVVSQAGDKVIDTFTKLPAVKDITAKGESKSSVITDEGAQVDLRVVEGKSYGAALIYFTGSKNFNIKIRKLAIKKNLKINEYGVFKLKGNKETYLLGRREEEIFKRLGLSFIEPELREDQGEVELAAQNKLPELVSLKDIKGDFHSHSKYSDGQQSILEMAEAAQAAGYAYLNISDHSQGLRVAGGLSIKELKTKKTEVDKINPRMRNFRILFGTEVDIDANGNLDYPDNVLVEFDVVLAAIHSGFKQSSAQITRRLVAACKNKNVDIIAHPTGRLWGTRDGYQVDFPQLFKAASDYGTALEINGYPLRLDLNDTHARQAKEKGVKLAISTDAHSASQLNYMRLGVATARRGWLTKDDVLNTLSYEELMKFFQK